MVLICGIRIQKFIYIDLIIVCLRTLIAIPAIIASGLRLDKFQGYGGKVAYYFYRVTQFVALVGIIGGNIWLYRSIKNVKKTDKIQRLKYYIKYRTVMIILFYGPFVWHYFYYEMHFTDLTLIFKSVKMFSIIFGFLSALCHIWIVRVFLIGFKNGELINPNDVTRREFLNKLTEEDKAFLKAIKISKGNVIPDFETLLGTGQFGKVFKGELKLKKLVNVAIKFVKYSNDQMFSNSIISELKTFARAGKHQNIVKIYGVTTRDLFIGIVLELCTGGDLKSVLVQKRLNLGDDRDYVNVSPDLLELIKYAQQIALGMEYLSSKKIIHSDLSARNILLTGDNVIKINDFGMSLHLYNYQLYATSKQTIFPWRWMPPESLIDLKFSIQSDIWSFGVVLFEIFTLGETPFKDIGWHSGFAESLQKGLRLPKPIYATREIYNLMNECWALNEDMRISFGFSVVQLNAIIYDLQLP